MEKFEVKEEHPFSGSYIRNLVKQLSSSRPRKVTHMVSSHAPLIARDHRPGDSLCKSRGRESTLPSPPVASHLPKKQGRRKLTTARTYQERIQDMTEARREIAMALKFHRDRAAMKVQASEQQKHWQPPQLAPATTCNIQSSLLPSFSTTCSSSTSPHFTPHPLSANLVNNFTLPAQPLGLNLNIQGFTDVETHLFRSRDIKSPVLHKQSSLSSSSTSSSSSYHSQASTTTTACAAADAPVSASSLIPTAPDLHPAMGDEEIEELRSISEKHDMEWNDTLNSVSTAWWCKLLTAMERDGGGENEEGDAYPSFSGAVDMSTWLCSGSGMNYCQGNYILPSQMDDDQLQEFTLQW